MLAWGILHGPVFFFQDFIPPALRSALQTSALWLCRYSGGTTWCITSGWNDGPVPHLVYSLVVQAQLRDLVLSVLALLSSSAASPKLLSSGCHLLPQHHGGTAKVSRGCFPPPVLATHFHQSFVLWHEEGKPCVMWMSILCVPTWFVKGRNGLKPLGQLPFPRPRLGQKSARTFLTIFFFFWRMQNVDS